MSQRPTNLQFLPPDPKLRPLLPDCRNRATRPFLMLLPPATKYLPPSLHRETFQTRKCSSLTASARHRRQDTDPRRLTAIWTSRRRTCTKSEMPTRPDPTSPPRPPIPGIKERACRTRESDPLPTIRRPRLTFPAATDTRIRISSGTLVRTPTRSDCRKTLRGAPARRLKTFHVAPAR